MKVQHIKKCHCGREVRKRTYGFPHLSDILSAMSQYSQKIMLWTNKLSRCSPTSKQEEVKALGGKELAKKTQDFICSTTIGPRVNVGDDNGEDCFLLVAYVWTNKEKESK